MKVLPGLNHLFQTANTGSVTEYAQIEETFSPAALTVIGDWIAERDREVIRDSRLAAAGSGDSVRRISPNRIREVLAGTIMAGLLCAGSVSAYTYSAYTAMTGAKTFAFNPFLYLEDFSIGRRRAQIWLLPTGYWTTWIFMRIWRVSYGLHGIPDTNPYYGSWIMPRFDFGGNNIAALQVGVTLDATARRSSLSDRNTISSGKMTPLPLKRMPCSIQETIP